MSDPGSNIYSRFARKLPGKAETLCSLVARLRSGADTDEWAEWLDRARREAHKLKGTASAYGYSRVSQCAGDIESALEMPAGVIDWAVISGALAELTAAANGTRECLAATMCGADTMTIDTPC